MSLRAERIRREMSNGSPFGQTMDSKQMHYANECIRRMYRNDKATRAEEARRRAEEFEEDFPVYQLERAITKLADGQATDADRVYLRRHNNEFLHSPLGIVGRSIEVIDFSGFQRRDYQAQQKISCEKFIATLPFIEPSED